MALELCLARARFRWILFRWAEAVFRVLQWAMKRTNPVIDAASNSNDDDVEQEVFGLWSVDTVMFDV